MSRVIDADALIADLEHDVAMDQDSLDNEELTETNRENIQFDKDCKQNAIDLLQHAPTIEERKKGKWTNDSACEFCGFQPWYERDIHTLNYCPNCGADMRGGQDERMDV